MTPDRAAGEIVTLRRFFRLLLPSTPDVLDAWQRIVVSLGIGGKHPHDAHLVAIMQIYSVTNILTFNVGHVRRFPGITVLDSTQV